MTAKKPKAPPKSIRKHLREQKAVLRRTLPAEEAEKAIEQLVRATRRPS